MSYDANGDLTGDGTNTYVWNARHQLVQIKQGTTVVASYAYKGTGRRISKQVGGARHRPRTTNGLLILLETGFEAKIRKPYSWNPLNMSTCKTFAHVAISAGLGSNYDKQKHVDHCNMGPIFRPSNSDIAAHFRIAGFWDVGGRSSTSAYFFP